MADLLLTTVWLVPGYALLGGLLAGAWSPGTIRKTGPRPSGYINLVLTFLAFVHSLFALPATWNQPAQQLSWTWLDAAGLTLTVDLKISALTVGAMALVTGLNLLAQIFAVGYMEMDWGWGRFYAMLGVFEAGICALILCNSLFFSYVILEVLTLGTYLLVGLWFSQPLVVTGARDAFLTKRVGDLIMLMGVVALLPLAGTWNFDELAQWAQTADLDPKVATLLGLALLAGPLGKCAQFPLHLWLDEAMEGPVPSTILRNSVVVATGAWVLIKLQPVLALSEIATTTAIYIGAVTAVGASAIAIAQIDIKRSLSYSVSAYMGLVFIAVGTGETQTALMLLLSHAVAMALLVTCTGGLIWNTITQDLTQYGGLWSRRPISGLAFLVGVAGLVALPPFGGFWSLLTMAQNLWQAHPELVGVLVVVNGLTAFSVMREFGLIFAGQPKPMTVRSPEVHWPMIIPMIILMGVTLHIPLILMEWNLLPDWANLNVPVAGALIGSTIVGGGLATFIYLSDRISKPVKFGPQSVQDFFAYDFYTAKLYKLTIVFAVGLVSQMVFWFDRYIVDGLVNLVGLFTLFSGQGLKYNVSGQTQFYALTILFGIAVLGMLLAWPSLSKIFLIFN
ncbi:NAD(P)H-quinone oxidoreductase subunit F [Laspinema sp. A4]|uniref:NAD(P)H-quinone oxidoreductase subunit F n=1 Tax=Laspinema sp. D2d TaxID=2953686 RepID=UPI0021BAB0F6|nr:NAD(P)H-quinone oxidoreductase subunit F [Laspinema sp. D2d]MCT7984535.1 NAD(P)H-quinone oxidoreductase subunit F [Laspinema sp. D2d]